MTDEEMAVNWIRSQGWNEETLPSDKFGQMIQAFIAGLGAGRPKWHKVADGDLPKENHFVWIFNERTGYEIARHAPFEEYRHDNWVTSDNRSLIPFKNKSPVIAWCEAPKYTEE